MEFIHTAVENHMELIQKRYDNFYITKDCWRPQILIGDDVYIDCLQHAALATNSAEQFVKKDHKAFMRCTRGTSKETKVQSSSVVIKRDGVLNRVTIDMVVPVLKSLKDLSQGTNTET